jgi:adenylate cyclase class 2
MPAKEQEIEVKFYVTDMPAIERKLLDLGARLAKERVHEVNLRFDTPGGELSRTFQVLRLRMDTAARLTYKGPGEVQEGVRVRREIEFTVGDFDSAHHLLEALGYEVSMMYEKYRTTYELEGALVTLDEMPFGFFIEIEGPDPASIRRINQQLALDWEARIPESYTALFERLRGALGFIFRDLSFENFEGLKVPPTELGVAAADGG